MIRTEDELQHAHDLLATLIEEQLVSPAFVMPIITSLDVLCWTLRHDHNTSFGDNITELTKIIEKHGFKPRRVSAQDVKTQLAFDQTDISLLRRVIEYCFSKGFFDKSNDDCVRVLRIVAMTDQVKVNNDDRE